MEKKKKILLLDSNSLINRAFHALPPLTLPDGTYTNAIFGYVSMLNKLISEEKPTHICAVFDCRAKTFRHAKYAAYKGTRKPMAEELAAQIPLLQALLHDMNILILLQEGVEADDIIGTIAKRFDTETLIVTGDRDMLQLVDDSTTVLLTKRGVSDVKRYTVPVLQEEGFTPRQIIEYKGLAGDSSDNIPGAPGVGEKTAVDLLQKFGDIDNLYQNLETLTGKLKEKLALNKDIVYLSRELATIFINVDIACSLEDMVFQYPLQSKAKEAMMKLQFKKLIDRFEYETSEERPTVVPVKTTDVKRVKINDKEALKKVCEGIRHQEIAVSWKNGISIADADTVFEIELSDSLLGSGIGDDDLKLYLSPLFGKNYKKIFFDVKHSMNVLKQLEICLEPPYEDLALKAYLTDPGRVIKEEEQLLSTYGLENEVSAFAMVQLNHTLTDKLNELELTNLYYDLELPLVVCLFDMEQAGFCVDITVLEELNAQYSVEIDELVKQIHFMAGEEFNVNSNKQLASILFEKLGLPHKKKNKTGFSVNAEVLEELEHPIAEVLLRYRQLTKLKSTYIDGMRNVMDQQTGKVHTCFKQSLTTTGRLSSTEPNLQNIPVRRAEGREIRRMFIPTEGNVLVSADYSQIELRLLAHMSEDDNLILAYENDIDIHTLTASKIFKTPLQDVDGGMRSSAKAVNFGIIYGISSFGLAKNASVSNATAKKFIDNYFETYPGVKAYMEQNVRLAKEQGYLRTILGRIRNFPELKSPQFNLRAFGERAAMNMPLQGSASDIIKLAMLTVDKVLKERKLNAKLILQVHDELILDVPQSETEEVGTLLKDCMENVIKLRIPLVANVAIGKNWYEAK